MARIDIVREVKLFLKTPSVDTGVDSASEYSTDLFLHDLEQNSDYTHLIDRTYLLIQKGELSIREVLKVWELRLTLLLFSGQLTYAKREAIQLSNALYRDENKTTNVMRQDEMQRGLQPIYPLPKNNDGLIHHDLMVLMLRLKSMPNSTLINELYKLNYQLRLKSREFGLQRTKKRCVNLSYEVVVILFINKNYITVLNLLQSIVVELQTELKHNPEDAEYNDYKSNVHLLLILLYSFIYKYQYKEAKALESILSGHFEQVDSKSLSALCCALERVEPTIPVENTSSDNTKSLPAPPLSQLNLPAIIDMVYSDRITTRIVCALLAVWDLTNRFDFRLDAADANSDSPSHHQIILKDESTPQGSPLEKCHAKVAARWPLYIHKVYGLE